MRLSFLRSGTIRGDAKARKAVQADIEGRLLIGGDRAGRQALDRQRALAGDYRHRCENIQEGSSSAAVDLIEDLLHRHRFPTAQIVDAVVQGHGVQLGPGSPFGQPLAAFLRLPLLELRPASPVVDVSALEVDNRDWDLLPLAPLGAEIAHAVVDHLVLANF